MEIVASTDAWRGGDTGAGGGQVVGRRDLHVLCVPLDDGDGQTRALGEDRLIGGLAPAFGFGKRGREYVPSKSLRRLRQPDLGARNRPADAPAHRVTLLDRVSCLYGGHSRSPL